MEEVKIISLSDLDEIQEKEDNIKSKDFINLYLFEGNYVRTDGMEFFDKYNVISIEVENQEMLFAFGFIEESKAFVRFKGNINEKNQQRNVLTFNIENILDSSTVYIEDKDKYIKDYISNSVKECMLIKGE